MAKVAGGGEQGSPLPKSPGLDGHTGWRRPGSQDGPGGMEPCTRPNEALTPLPSGPLGRLP